MPLILRLRQAAAADPSLVGGKAANLGRLVEAGLPVPGGFVVTTEAYRAQVERRPVAERVDALAEMAGATTGGGLPAGSVGRRREAAARVREAIESRDLPAPVREAVVGALGAWPVEEAAAGEGAAPPADLGWAVRSSAAAEDLGEASFAGQHDTFLGLRGPETVLAAIRACMAGLFTDRAVAYRAREGIPARAAAMAVVVQRMAPAEAAGVLFTADPVSGDRRVAVVEATFGLGAPLVAGEVEPDRARVDRRTGEVLAYETARKPTAVRLRTGPGGHVDAEPGGADGAPLRADDGAPRPGPAGEGPGARTGEPAGTETVALPEHARDGRVLDDDRLRELAALGGEIETLFGGRPQDVEWSMGEDGSFHVLQARPVTALPPVPEPAPSDGRLRVYLNMGPMQAVSEPMPPLVRDFWKTLLDDAMGLVGGEVLAERWCAEAAGRVYIDVTPLLRVRALRSRVPDRLAQGSEPAAEALRALLRRRPDAFRGGSGLTTLLVGAARAEASSLLRRAPRLAVSFAGAFVGEPPDLDEERRFYEAWGRRLAATIHEPDDPAERVRRALDPLGSLEDFTALYPRLMRLTAGLAAGAALERLFPDAPEEVSAAGAGFPREIITRMNQELGDVADVARRHPEVAAALRDGRPLDEVYAADGGGAFREAFEAYLGTFGHRATGEIDMSNPRWREDPSSLLQVVRANLGRRKPGAHRERLRELVAEGEAAARRLEERAGRGVLGFLWKPFVVRLLRTYRGCLPIREMPKHGGGHFFSAFRAAFVSAGERLAEAGELERAEDVWFLRGDELLAALEDGAPVAADVAARRARHERHRRTDAPVVLTSEGVDAGALVERGDLPEGALRGTGVSAGVVEGTARVVRDPAASSVAPGEILVAPSCGPGWTPLYLNAAGLVAEVGGRISHGALVAREYGLPAVVSVRGATREIRTGQRLRVDGTRGLVEVLERATDGPPGAST